MEFPSFLPITTSKIQLLLGEDGASASSWLHQPEMGELVLSSCRQLKISCTQQHLRVIRSITSSWQLGEELSKYSSLLGLTDTTRPMNQSISAWNQVDDDERGRRDVYVHVYIYFPFRVCLELEDALPKLICFVRAPSHPWPLAIGNKAFLILFCLCLLEIPGWRLMKHPDRDILSAGRKCRELTAPLSSGFKFTNQSTFLFPPFRSFQAFLSVMSRVV